MRVELTPVSAMVENGAGEHERLWKVELRDLARAFCGGLVVALPLLYTMEMWERAMFMSGRELLPCLAAAYLINVGALHFSGFRSPANRRRPWIDALTALGVGALAATVTLLLIGRLNYEVPLNVMVKLVALELVPVSLGASLALSQLGVKRDEEHDWGSPDGRIAVATIVGAVLFAFNVAPTIEPKLILLTTSSLHVLAIAAFSLFVSWLMVDFARFSGGRDDLDGSLLPDRLTAACFSYILSLGVSAGLLWMFGYIDSSTALTTAVPWTVILGYATTIGGAAGKLIL